jgi:hypothetical protein
MCQRKQIWAVFMVECINRRLRKSASFVLGSSKSSTYRSGFSEVGSAGGVFPFAKIHCAANGPTKCGRYLLRLRLVYGLARGTARLGAPGLGG